MTFHRPTKFSGPTYLDLCGWTNMALLGYGKFVCKQLHYYNTQQTWSKVKDSEFMNTIPAF